MANNDNSFELKCFLLDDKHTTFSIRVLSSFKVAELIPEIKQSYDLLATGGTLSGIALYQVNAMVKELSGLKSPPEDSYPLSLINSVGDYWPDSRYINEWCIQILIKAQVVAIQPQEESVKPDSKPSSQLEPLASLQEEAAKYYRCDSSDSSAAQYSDFELQQVQGKTPIYNGRPINRTASPIELFHPAFDVFATQLEKTENLSASHYAAVEELMVSSQAFHGSDCGRWWDIKDLVADAIKYPMDQDDSCSDESGGVVVLTDAKWGHKPYGALVEISDEIGAKNPDPSVKGAQSYAKYWSQEEMTGLRQATPCPSLIISFVGPWLCVWGAVYLEHVVVQPLTDFIWLGRHPQQNRRQMRVVRVFDAIATTIAALEKYYTPFVKPDSTLSIDHQRFFPYIRSVRSSEGLIHFSYKRRLSPETMRSLFEAVTDDGRRLVVKFSESYHYEAHKLLSDRSLAPKLISQRAEPVGGNLFMVVMELSGTSLERYLSAHPKLDHSALDRVRADVQDALEILHAHNLVFGDLRQPNVLVTQALRGQLVDFDWCGLQGQARYPIGMNQSWKLGWPPGVQKGSLMFKQHDRLMLQRLFGQSRNAGLFEA
ncbi:unnamed protein product [Rhizoctonia solani]|uniref:Tyrosine kinase n=1 Tax=Rhizoctonia solani AG-3 Rhs1AP TaxID=1086054 RepID=X8J4C1_9AGAM|nr:tyrosine kinase [Rhizoctonia solani AG-3 Rhs1AP]CAE6449760.1 unnamed protein product [Rhizoctonia solani]